MNSFQLEELIKNIQTMIRCPNCGNSYKKENIHFLGQLGQAVLVQLSCYACKMPVMATIVVSGSVSDMPTIKEIEQYSNKLPKIFSEANKIENKDKEEKIDKPVSSDDVLELHEFLENFDGDFENLFNK